MSKTADGYWVRITWPDGSGRNDWVPIVQPPPPPGSIAGEWHAVKDAESEPPRWEWHERGQIPPHPPGRALRYSSIPIPDDLRRRIWAAELQQAMTKGCIESQSEFGAVIVQGHPHRIWLHLLGALFTCGIWLIFWWYFFAFTKPVRRTFLHVDECGNVIRSVTYSKR